MGKFLVVVKEFIRVEILLQKIALSLFSLLAREMMSEVTGDFNGFFPPLFTLLCAFKISWYRTCVPTHALIKVRYNSLCGDCKSYLVHTATP